MMLQNGQNGHLSRHVKSRSEGSNGCRYHQQWFHDCNHINKKLPKELVLRVFSFLDVVTLCRCSQVCKAWNLLALDGSNWQHVDLFQFQKDVEGPVVENLSKRCGGFLKSLSLRGCQVITDQALGTFAEQCRNIESLNLNNCKQITDVRRGVNTNPSRQERFIFSNHLLDENEILRLCKLLASGPGPSGKWCLLAGSSIEDWKDFRRESASFCSGSSCCKHLQHVNISWCVLLSNKAVEALSVGCKEITTFICHGMVLVTDDGIRQLAVNCPNLLKLSLQGCPSIGDEAISAVSQHCLELKSICLSNCTNITDASLRSLGQDCHKLRTLEVSGCANLTDNGFQSLARNCPDIQKLDLEECVQITDVTLGHLSLHCHNISYLMLSHCELITDEGIRHIGHSPRSSESLTVLEMDNCPLVTDAALEHLVNCWSLQRIELYDCQLITRSGIRRLRNRLPCVRVHAYFAPATPPPIVGGARPRYCKCCTVL